MKNIGKYEILGFLGKGSWSLVLKVRMPLLDRVAALKLLHPDPLLADLMGEARMEELFLGEGRLLASINHPGVLEVWDMDYWRGRPFYVMEYHCVTLRDIMGGVRDERPLRLDQITGYVLSALDALDALHEAGIIHRDIKPDNLLLPEGGGIKIADFGLVYRKDKPIEGLPSNLVVGSPYYSAPEQERKSRELYPQTDLYSVGVILYKGLTGKVPDGDYPLPSAVNKDCDREWDAFFQKALAGSPKDRFPSAHAMCQELESLLQAWHERIGRLCGLAPAKSSSHPTQGLGAIRRDGILVPPGEAVELFRLDTMGRPRGFAGGRLRPYAPDVVRDEVTGMLWSQEPAARPVTWADALEAAEGRASKRWMGFADWHLPTVEELATIMSPVPQAEDHCTRLEMPAAEGEWAWSSDRATAKKSWCANMHNSTLVPMDVYCKALPRFVSLGRTS